jgi:hypothetical protein
MSNDQSRDELKPCPFCGGTSIDVSDGFAACCNNCLADGPIQIGERGPAAAAKYWNYRAPDAAQARIAELEAQLSSAREVAMEEALRVCEAEALEDPQVGTEDIAYDLAVSHCAEAIRQLAAKADKRPAAKEE